MSRKDQYLAKLSSERAGVLDLLARLLATTNHNDGDLALILVLQRRLAAIEQAVRRLHAGDYGVCERCGQLIAPERLDAVPEVTLCADCAARITHLGSRRQQALPLAA